MPPELLTTGRLSKAADTYAFGVLLWEMYTGQRPWAGMLQMQIIFNVTVQSKQLQFPQGAPQQIKARLSRRSQLSTTCVGCGSASKHGGMGSEVRSAVCTTRGRKPPRMDCRGAAATFRRSGRGL